MAELGSSVGSRPLTYLILPLLVSSISIYPLIEGFKDYKKFVVSRAGSIELFTPSQSWSQGQKKQMEGENKD